MADVLLNLVEQTPVAGIAVGGALVAAAVGYGAVKAFGGGATSPKAAEASDEPTKAKTKKPKAKKPKAPAATAPDSASEAPVAPAPKKKEVVKADEPAIDLSEFVADYPDSEEEEEARKEKLKLKRKLKKKNANAKAKAAASAAPSGADVSQVEREKAKAAAAAAAAKKDEEEGWTTVANKKVNKVKTN